MKKEVSRQRRWQLRQKAAGLCEICNKKVFKAGRCARHYLKQLAATRKKHGYKAWTPGGRGRPPRKDPE